MDYSGMSAAIQALGRLSELKQEFEQRVYYGKTRQAWEWSGLPVADRKILLMLAGVGNIDAMDNLAKRGYLELTPAERDAIGVALRSLRRLCDKAASLGALGAGVVRA